MNRHTLVYLPFLTVCTPSAVHLAMSTQVERGKPYSCTVRGTNEINVVQTVQWGPFGTRFDSKRFFASLQVDPPFAPVSIPNRAPSSSTLRFAPAPLEGAG